ncbi:hypothetical protein Tco_1242190 [Tanacetum coccineum]
MTYQLSIMKPGGLMLCRICFEQWEKAKKRQREQAFAERVSDHEGLKAVGKGVVGWHGAVCLLRGSESESDSHI